METAFTIEKLEKVAFVLKTIAHPLRIGIVDLLSTHERASVSEICKSLKSEQSLISHHLSTMKTKGILSSKRQGQRIYYFLEMKEVVGILACMEKFDI